MKSFRLFLKDGREAKPAKAATKKAKTAAIKKPKALPFLDEVIISSDGLNYEHLDEHRKWIDGRFKRNIGIDKPTHGAGQEHGHVLGRKGNQLVVVNIDGTASHGTKGKLHKKDAAALRARGYDIRADNMIEWNELAGDAQLLLG